ncbi:MAG: diadenylate cyclase CdaA [Oscillospiraceae bacterium]|nr:diadenylate cyclase CdaA [Oscillospiraceae bacterium]
MSETWIQFVDVIRTVGLADVIDIVCISYLVYKLVSLVRETRAAQLIKGILIILAAYLISDLAKMQTMQFVMEYILDNGLIVLVVVFQPELRRALEQVGRSKFSKFGFFISHQDPEQELEQNWQGAIDAICESLEPLSSQKIGALMVIERKTRLGEIIKTGTIIDSRPSMELIGNVFFPNSPLHDGAMVIRDGKLHAAGCFLPLSENYGISKQLGTRHRAALGMSENSDAIVVVVSEETGVISIAHDGVLRRNYTPQNVRELLEKELLPSKSAEGGERKPVFWRVKK